MAKPLVAIDLDNVLAQSAEGLVAFSNDHFSPPITLDDVSEDWPAMWGVSHEEARRRGKMVLQHNSQRDYEPVPGAKEVLDDLGEHYELAVLTSRRREAKQSTTLWLDRYFPKVFGQVVLSGLFDTESTDDAHLLTKGERYTELGASYVIDDQLKHCEAAVIADAEAILFGDYPWNNRTSALPKGVVRCRNWLEVQRYLSEKLMG